MPRVNIWIPEDKYRKVQEEKKKTGLALGQLLIKLIEEKKDKDH